MRVAKTLVDRYEVVRQLGSGGAGDLVLVRDRKREDEPCALKVLRSKQHDPALEPLFRSEFLLLTEVKHDSIVAVRDFGTLEDGAPYFTMDFVPGENCRAFVREDRLETTDYLDVASRLLSALSHVHARGILHRDIKPENIIVRRGDGRLEPVLIDFGLAMTAGARRAGEACGTLPYIAPEVVAGARATPAADLFSLGMVLLELSLGKHISTPGELLRGPERTLAPERVRRVMKQSARGTVPRRFEEFVARLVAPTPATRFSSAAVALAALAGSYGEEFGVGAAETVTRPKLAEAPQVGRKGALDHLVQRLDALREGGLLAPLVVVAGAEGIGVSRLLATLRNQAAVSGCVVASGSSLRELATELAPAGEAGDSPAGHVFRIDAVVHELAQDQHPVLILDDVHACTHEECEVLRDWINALERRPGRARVMLVLGGRNVGDGPGVEILKTAGGSVPVEVRDLAPLSAADVRSALATILDQPRVPAPVVQALHRATGGNPRLLAELLSLLVEEEILDVSGERPVLKAELLSAIKLPRGVTDAARRRIAQLPKDAAAALARLALVETALPYAAARPLLGPSLDRLVDERFLEHDRGRIRFVSELTRRGAGTLKGKAREAEVARLAELLRADAPRASARLFAEAGDVVAARAVGLPAARSLLADGRLEEARALLRQLLGADLDSGVASALLSVQMRIGRHAEAAELAHRLLLQEPDETLTLKAAGALHSAGQPDAALAALKRIDRETEGDLAARVANAKAAIFNAMGRQEEALLESGRAEAAAGSLLGLDGRVGRTREFILSAMGRRRAATRALDMLVDAPPESVSTATRIAALRSRAVRRFESGRLRAALTDARAAMRLAAAHGLRLRWAGAVETVANVLSECGRNARAARLYEQALRFYEDAASEEDAGHTLANLATNLLLQGRPTEAEARLARAASLPRFDRIETVRGVVGALRAEFAALGGRSGESLAAIEEMDSGADRSFATAEVQLNLEDIDAAEEAWQDLLQRAWRERLPSYLPYVRVGLAECAVARGAWHLAEKRLGHRAREILTWATPQRARSLVVRAGAALHRREPGAAGRLIEEAVAVANRCQHGPTRARVYAAAASLLEEGEFQRFLRQPTAGASAALLEVARDIWLHYGNETMLRKIDLHLAELPRAAASDPLGGPDADRLVKVLHITREMNREFDRDRLLGLILDRAIELTGAERGFVILLQEGREEVHIARNIDREAISEPERKVSTNVIREVVHSGRIVRTENAEGDTRYEEYLSVRQLHLKSIMAVPFRAGGKTIGALYLDNRFRTASFTEEDERLLELFADQAVAAIDKAALVRELRGKHEELEEHDRQQKLQLRKRGTELKHAHQELKQHRKARGWGFDKIIARSVSMQGLLREAKRFAASELPTLITGENGTGKELAARAMHYGSPREAMSFVAVNCAAFAEGLLEAELFGHVRGSFTGADRDRVGLFEEADGGTLFLDEVGDMSLPMQVRLLRALDQGEIKRVGESKTRSVDVRVIAATNADLEQHIRNGRFREDLYYRLSGFVLRIPPLRERLEDVEPLAYAFVEEAARREGRPGLTLANDAIARLESYSWPGNVRELRNVILRAVVSADTDTVNPEHIKFDTRGPTVLPGLDPAKADAILDAITKAGVELNSRQQTAVNRVLTRGKLTFAEYRELFRVSKSTTARDLDGLVEERLLEKRGKTRAVIYLPGVRLQEIAKKFGGR